MKPLTAKQQTAVRTMARDPERGWERVGMRTLDGLTHRGLATHTVDGQPIRGAVLTAAGLAEARKLGRLN